MKRNGKIGLLKYKKLPPDEARGNPQYQLGVKPGVGTYWTIPVEVSVNEMVSILHPRAISSGRYKSIDEARDNSIHLEPIEIGVYPEGSAWLIDGNHRLVNAKRRGDSMILARFTFQER